MTTSVYMKPKSMIGRCRACGRSTKLHVHQECGAKLAAQRNGLFRGDFTAAQHHRRVKLSKTQL